MNCQHCQTELTSKRAKNCPVCSDLLQKANKAGTYGFVCEAIAAAKADGLTGTDMHEAMRSAAKAGAAKRAWCAVEYRQRIEQRKREESERIRFYQTHGYWPGSWPGQDEEQLEAEEAAEFERRQRERRGLSDQQRADILSEES